MISLLLMLLIAAVAVGVVIWIIRTLPLPAPWGNIAQVLVAVIFLIFLLQWSTHYIKW